MSSARRKKRNSNTALLAVIALLVAILIGLVSCGLPAVMGDATQPPVSTGDQTTGSSTPAPSSNPETEPSTQPETAPPTQPKPEPVTMRVVTDVTAYAEPDEKSATVGNLTLGTQVDVIGTDNGWSTILLDSEQCYVPSKTLRDLGEYLVVIDPGHQGKGNFEKEPDGPGSTVMKNKVAAGTTGVSTKIPEYKLTLAVSFMLRDVLEARGYQVVMLRESHDVNISNAERAIMANELYADAFVRVHANGSENQSVNGIVTICQTKKNPYNADLYQYSKELSSLVLDEMVAVTGAKKLYVWEVDTMSGINWCQVPVTIVEMGFMSNPAEDELMATEEYRQKLAEGIANGIDKYFA